MIKYFHELTKDEFLTLVDRKLTCLQVAEDYPQPVWCGYPEAVRGVMGCWSLMDFLVTGRNYCKNCDLYISKKKGVK